MLEYFDASMIGLTATPSKQTLGFFNQNLVMEYNHEQAVADKVNVDFDVYRIQHLPCRMVKHCRKPMHLGQDAEMATLIRQLVGVPLQKEG